MNALVNFEQVLTERQIDNRLAKLEDIGKQIRALEALADSIRAEVQDAMSGDFLETKNFRVFWKEETRKSLSSAWVRKEFPAFWNMYATETKVRPFKAKRK